MKFLTPWLTLEALTPNARYKNPTVFENKFKKQYIKVERVSSVEKEVKFHVWSEYDKQWFVHELCEVQLDDGHYAIVRQECDDLVRDINEGTK